MSKLFVMQVEEIAEKLFVKNVDLGQLVKRVGSKALPDVELEELQAVAKASLFAAAIFVAEMNGSKEANADLGDKLGKGG